MPKVSVIIPNYNHARFLRQRIDSVLDQTYSDFELLILDDVSTDESVSVIESYASDPRISSHFNESNSGSPYRQWRAGLARTSGEYVWIAESDDFAAPTLLQRLVALLDANPTVGIATCDCWEVDSEGKELNRYSQGWREKEVFGDYDCAFLDRELVMNGRDYCRQYMDPWNTIPNASAAVFRRSALEAIGGPVVEMKLCGDWLTYCKMLMHSDMARAPEALSYFRRHAVSVRTQTKAVDFVRESLAVHAFVGRELGLGDRHRRSTRVHEFFSQILVATERAGEQYKVPLKRVPAVLRSSTEFGPGIFTRTLGILLKEQAASVAHRLGLRR